MQNNKPDISILVKTGHFHFGLTKGKKGSALYCYWVVK